jgi:dTDP-4-dehydrorhamnose 3,5-epimerase
VYDVRETSLPGVLRLKPNHHRDVRGSFVKIFHAPTFRELGLHADFPEVFYSISARGVLRGLHHQQSPHGHVKLVACLSGSILDVAVDLRKGSPTRGRHEVFELSGECCELLYIPDGLAHGFLVRSESALVHYQTSTVHSPEADAGVRWDSCGIPWPHPAKIVSPRDAGLPTLAEYLSAPCL